MYIYVYIHTYVIIGADLTAPRLAAAAAGASPATPWPGSQAGQAAVIIIINSIISIMMSRIADITCLL